MYKLPEAVDHERGDGFDGKSCPNSADTAYPAKRRVVRLAFVSVDWELDHSLTDRNKLQFIGRQRLYGIFELMEHSTTHLDNPLLDVYRHLGPKHPPE
jgi:hypothetical protein